MDLIVLEPEYLTMDLPVDTKNLSTESRMLTRTTNLKTDWEILQDLWTDQHQGDATTLQGIDISHLGKRKIIFKMPFLGDMLVPWRVSPFTLRLTIHIYRHRLTVWAASFLIASWRSITHPWPPKATPKPGRDMAGEPTPPLTGNPPPKKNKALWSGL